MGLQSLLYLGFTMIDEISFTDYISVGPQGTLEKRVVNNSAVLDYRIKLEFDSDPRFVKLIATKAASPGALPFVQLLSISSIVSITIAADPVAPAPKEKRPYNRAEKPAVTSEGT